MAEPDEPFMSIRWDEDQAQPATRTVLSEAAPMTDPVSSEGSGTLVVTPEPGPSSSYDRLPPYTIPAGAGRAALAAEQIDPPKWPGYLRIQVLDPHKEGSSGPEVALSSTSIVDETSVANAAANGGVAHHAGKDAFVS